MDNPILKALALATAMFAIATLAVFEIVPASFAQYAPLATLALFPGAWLGRNRSCARSC